MQNIHVADSRIAGKGIFADRDFQKNEVIFRVTGPTIHYPGESDYRLGPDWLQVGQNTWKIAVNGNVWRYINHCCEPNAGLHGRTQVVAMRNIKAGEEITIDYSITEAGRRWHMQCHCGTASCRRTIRSAQFLSRELFAKYQSFIPQYLQKVYLAEKTYIVEKAGKRSVHAKHRIKKNERIFRVVGPVVRFRMPPDYRIGYRWLAVAKNQWIVPLRHTPWWCIGNSCNPNVGIIGRDTVVAMHDIAPDEELVVDDSMTEADPRWQRTCDCCARQCRGIVRSVQFLPAALFKKYKPYTPTFIRKVYQRSQRTK